MVVLAQVYQRVLRLSDSGDSNHRLPGTALGARLLVVSDGSYPGREVLLIDQWMGQELDSVWCFQNRYLGYKFWRQQRHNE